MFPYTIIAGENESNVTAFIPGDPMPLVAHSSHPNFDKIVGCLVKGEACTTAEFRDLFDVSQAVAEKFRDLSERVSVSNGRVFFDGDEVSSTLTQQIVRFMDEGVDDWKPLVAFFDKVQQNPQEHSRQMLFDWLDAHDFTITESGDIVGYKGVRKNADGTLVSGFTGTATVNGEVVRGHIPNEVGSVITMPRSSVAFDPGTACSTGLHVGTFRYAKGYASGAMLEVHVNPRDVVSVPTDAAGEKVRTCRYEVVKVIDAPYSGSIRWDDVCDEDEGDGIYQPEFAPGDEVIDSDGDEGTIVSYDSDADTYRVDYGDDSYGVLIMSADELESNE